MTSDETEAIAAQLAAWIWDENRVITAKILARQRPLHINAAKRHLAAFARQAQRPLDVIYGLSGRVAGRRTVAWVPHDDLARAEAAFSPLTSKYVDAVAPPGLITAHGLFTANMNEIRAQPHLNSYAAIYDRRCVPRIQSDDEPEIAKPQVKAEIKTEEPVLTPVEKPPVKPATTKANRGRIAGLFAKAAVAKKAEPEVKTETNELSPGQENRLNEEKEAQTQDSAPVPSRNQKRTAQKSRHAANQPKRRRIKVMSDSDSSEAEAESEPIEIEDVPAPPQARLIESDDEDEMIPPTPEPKSQTQPVARSTAPGRRRVRKMVNKTFTDDQGFTVTKKTMESGSETDDEAQESSTTEDRPVLQAQNKQAPKSVVQESSTTEDRPVLQAQNKQAPKSVVQEPTKKSPAKVKQASIMNFFQKKATK